MLSPMSSVKASLRTELWQFLQITLLRTICFNSYICK